MEYAKIVVKSSYEQRGDLVLRSYIRALKKSGKIGELFLSGDEALVFGVVDPEGNFHELFTNNIIDYSGYSSLTSSEFSSLCEIIALSFDEEIETIELVMEVVLFDKKRNLDFEISTMEDHDVDRKEESRAYECGLSSIDPYERCDDQQGYMSYNNFECKIRNASLLKGKSTSVQKGIGEKK